jgi:hypothetical protein
MNSKNSFIVHTDNCAFDVLSDEQMGKLFRAMIAYASGEDVTLSESDPAYWVFLSQKSRIDADAAAYEESKSRRRAAGRKRWQKSNEATEAPNDAKQSQEKDQQEGTSEQANEQQCTAKLSNAQQSIGKLAVPVLGTVPVPVKKDKNPFVQTPSRTLRSQASKSALTAQFEELWMLYPKKRGKEPARRAFMRAIRDGTSVEEIRLGIEAYAVYRKGKDEQYTLDGSTFFSQKRWQDDWTKEKGVMGDATKWAAYD